MPLYQYLKQPFTTLTVGVARPVLDTVSVFHAAVHYTDKRCTMDLYLQLPLPFVYSQFHQGYHAWGVHIPPRLSCLGSPYSTKAIMPGESIFHQDCHAWGVHIPPRLSCPGSPYSTKTVMPGESIFHQDCHACGVHIPPIRSFLWGLYSTHPIMLGEVPISHFFTTSIHC